MTTIGFWLTDFNSHVQKEFYAWVEKIAAERGVRVIGFVGGVLANTPANIQRNRCYELMNNQTVQGFIAWSSILATFMKAEDCTRFMAPFAELPMVSIGMEIPHANTISANDYQGAYEAVCHLVRDHGRTTVACFRGTMHKQSAIQRYQGYLDALNDCGVPFRADLVFSPARNDLYSLDDVEKIIKDNEALLSEIEAFAMFNDILAKHLLVSLKNRGIAVPRDKLIIGYDNSADSPYFDPPLTSVSMPLENLAREALDRLLGTIAKTNRVDQPLPASRLIVRNSCGCGSSFQSDLSNSLPDKLAITTITLDSLIAKATNLNIFSSVSKTDIAIFINDFSNALRQALDQNLVFNEPLKIFRSMLYQITKTSHLSLDWQKCLSLLSQHSLQTESDPIRQKKLSTFFNILRENAAEYIDKIHFEYNFIRQYKNDILSLLSYELSSQTNMVDSLSSIAKNCALLKISTLHIVFFEERDPAKLNGQLMLSIVDSTTVQFAESMANPLAVFPISQLIPDYPIGYFEANNLTVMPLTSDTEFFGYFLVVMKDKTVYSDTLSRFQQILSTHLLNAIISEENHNLKAELAIANEQAQTSVRTSEHYYNISIKDELTGVYNRRGFMSRFSDMRSDPVQTEALALFFLDMDNLKTINDTYGHDEGDVAIKACSDILVRSFRKSDIVSRYGGDEFIVIARGVNEQVSMELKNRLIEVTSQVNHDLAKPYQIEFSSGFSFLLDQDTRPLEAIIQQADAQLYLEKRAKKLGPSTRRG
jgi:diguanylate cyclase (GGDEF)-like protein